MARSKYINTFNTTSDYDAYIDSALPEFPNVALDKQENKLKIQRTSPNSHVIYGTLTNPNTPPTFKFNNNNNQKVTAHVDLLDNTFYIDASDMSGVTTPITSLGNFLTADNNVTSIKKIKLDTTHVTSISGLFYVTENLTSIDLTSFNLSSFTGSPDSTFYRSNSLTDVYVSYENTLNIITNNLSSQGNSYVPSSATIHYNGTDYKWQNNAWTPQS